MRQNIKKMAVSHGNRLTMCSNYLQIFLLPVQAENGRSPLSMDPLNATL